MWNLDSTKTENSRNHEQDSKTFSPIKYWVQWNQNEFSGIQQISLALNAWDRICRSWLLFGLRRAQQTRHGHLGHEPPRTIRRPVLQPNAILVEPRFKNLGANNSKIPKKAEPWRFLDISGQHRPAVKYRSNRPKCGNWEQNESLSEWFEKTQV